MIYFTSDTHFGHANIINLSKRPFSQINEMNQALITNWNARVQADDDIYILGDFSYKTDVIEINRILKQLNGRKYLIIGNHDTYLDDVDFNRHAFVWIKDYYVLRYEKYDIVLFHYPILEWQGFFSDALHLYGHVHNSTKDPSQKSRLNILGSRAMNVGVDVNNYFPVSMDEVLHKILPSETSYTIKQDEGN